MTEAGAIECLDEETILAFCRGGVAKSLRPPIEQHLGECDECRALVSAVARSSLVDPRELMADPAIAPTTPAPGAFDLGASATTPSSPPRALGTPNLPRAGELLAGKYLVDRVLGAGGMGVVVAARHTQLDQKVALKFLLPAACEAPSAIARFLREGKAAASITSEHVARVVDTGVLDNGSPYLVMEYLEGSDLGALTAERGPIPPSDAVEYVLQACEAIVEAHQLGIVHRDLKPANLFLARRKDGSPLVKVLDFGISKSEGGSRSQLTSTTALMGSPRYMSPEQMVSARDVDARTDVWALGVILYELTTGRPVWEADTVQGLCALIASAPAPPLRQRAPHAPALLEEVIARCLAKSPNERIASVADLALALEPIAPESAKTSIERILRVAGRTRHDRVALAQREQPFVAAATTASTTTTQAEPTSSSGRTIAIVLGALVGVLVLAGVALNILGRRPVTTTTAPPASDVTTASASSPASPEAPASVAIPAPAEVVSSAPAPSVVRAPPPATTTRSAKPRATASAAPPPPSPTPTMDTSPNRALTDRK